MQSLDFQPIGYIQSCYKEKFGIPRQPYLVPGAKSQLVLSDQFSEESVRGLEGFSHIWLQFIFHETQQQGWKAMVRPPRLGGNKKMGVFATRSMFRPNPIGLSVVKLDKVEIINKAIILHLLGCDLLDQTPVLDIKPYLAYADSISDSTAGYFEKKPSNFVDVIFSEQADIECKLASSRLDVNIKELISQILAQDPRPGYQQTRNQTTKEGIKEDRTYAMKLYDFDLRWQYCENNKIKVLAINT